MSFRVICDFDFNLYVYTNPDDIFVFVVMINIILMNEKFVYA